MIHTFIIFRLHYKNGLASDEMLSNDRRGKFRKGVASKYFMGAKKTATSDGGLRDGGQAIGRMVGMAGREGGSNRQVEEGGRDSVGEG